MFHVLSYFLNLFKRKNKEGTAKTVNEEAYVHRYDDYKRYAYERDRAWGIGMFAPFGERKRNHKYIVDSSGDFGKQINDYFD